ncbi:MAG: hypothetical protein PQJ61_15280 [Spirochaetales bacterium]|uniref:Uncharacterized protein n=1 Tax=Candidatus Thalassospirochaeta sargassi TaxID=3119039 RepID=A0AAJ1MNQ8_9SPIO|nr:hypothetical protein [Spirochaetales bacterium]
MLKAFANSLTVVSGMSAGFAGPAIIFGLHYSLPAALGAVIGFQINRSHTP